MRAIILMVGLLAAEALMGSGGAAPRWQVCLTDEAGLNTPARAAFQREFSVLVSSREADLVWDLCDAVEPGAIILRVRTAPPSTVPEDALGLARLKGPRITAPLEVYVAPVMQLLDGHANCWAVVGRALARVAAHEVAHLLTQKGDHDQQGLLREGFSGSELAGESSEPFRRLAQRD
jgi:hypothetical protein